MRALVWALVFVAVQVALLWTAGRALAVVRPRPRRSLPVRLLQWGLGILAVLGFIAVTLPAGHGLNYEGRTISVLRQVTSAQEAFRSAAEVYGPLECLAEPSRCIPGYQGPVMLTPSDPEQLERSLQYRLTFHAGPAVTSATGARGIQAWSYVANPATRRTRGMRSFCIDASGLMVVAAEPITVTNAVCPRDLPAAN